MLDSEGTCWDGLSHSSTTCVLCAFSFANESRKKTNVSAHSPVDVPSEGALLVTTVAKQHRSFNCIGIVMG